jgi:hypothetical protein
MEIDPVSKTLCLLEYWTMDKIQKPSNPENQKKCLSSMLCCLVLMKVEDSTQQESNVNNILTDGKFSLIQ